MSFENEHWNVESGIVSPIENKVPLRETCTINTIHAGHGPSTWPRTGHRPSTCYRPNPAYRTSYDVKCPKHPPSSKQCP
uniref:Uncharacterized protein n=1 Tax=Magallana gigas TaxID=29159 RepID=K1QYN1_MAGGI